MSTEFGSWEYRAMRHRDERGEYYYDMREVYYREGAPEVPDEEWVSAWSQEPIAPMGDTAMDLLHGTKLLYKALAKSVLDEWLIPGYGRGQALTEETNNDTEN